LSFYTHAGLEEIGDYGETELDKEICRNVGYDGPSSSIIVGFCRIYLGGATKGSMVNVHVRVSVPQQSAIGHPLNLSFKFKSDSPIGQL
jgi:hypothetical protein